MRLSRLVMASLVTVTLGCNEAATQPDQETLYIYAVFASPTVTVRVNGQVLGQLTRQYTGGTDCPSLAHVVTPGTVLTTTVHLGQAYALTWDYSNGATDSDQLSVTSDMLEQTDCLLESISAKSSSAHAP